MIRNPHSCDIRCGRAATIRSAFTLVETLAVLAIVSVLGMLVLPVLQNGRERQLVMGGNMVVDLTQQARQNSMARGVYTALVVVTQGTQGTSNYRTFTLMELKPGASEWQAVIPWRQLPGGVMLDAALSNDFFASQPTLPFPMTLLPCNGHSVSPSECAFQIFTPYGGLMEPVGAVTDPQLLRVVSAREIDGKLEPVPGNAGYYDVIINRYTGIAKVDRP